MALAVMDDIRKRCVGLLNANPGVWSASVASGMGAFPSIEEIDDAIYEAEARIVTQGYFQSANTSLTAPFDVTTAPFRSQAPLPFHHGTMNTMQLSTTAQNFTSISVANQIPLTAHGLTTGQLVSFVTTVTLPTGLALLTNYYVIVVNANVISVATSLTNALIGTAAAITNGTGSGTHTLISWEVGVEAKAMDDITNATRGMDAYVGSGAYDFLYKADKGVLFTTADYWRVTYPEFTSNAVLQINQNESALLVFMACSFLVKNASPALFAQYDALANAGLQQIIQDGVYSEQFAATQ